MAAASFSAMLIDAQSRIQKVAKQGFSHESSQLLPMGRRTRMGSTELRTVWVEGGLIVYSFFEVLGWDTAAEKGGTLESCAKALGVLIGPWR